jgi:hypothetical protein
MNDSTRTQLKIIVERAVRPVRASMCHKLKLREELLAHVSAVFEEEEARLDNEQAALERTAQRFGNPAELTGQLQVSVPTSDFLQRFFEGMALRTDESTLRRAVRFAVVTFFVCAVFLLPVWSCLFGSWSLSLSVWSLSLSVWSFSCLFGPPMVFFFVVSSDSMRQALYGRLWRRAAVVAAASSFLIPGVTFGLLLTFSGDVRSSLTDVLPLLPAAVLTPVFFVVPVYCFAADFRSHREWMSLQIN